MKCIIIDDDEVARTALEHFVRQTDFLELVRTFPDPVQALSYLSQAPVDLVFLDIEMPGMNGMEFLRAVQQRAPQVILTTSHPEFALEAFEHQVADYLIKPLDYPRFFKAVMRARAIAGTQSTPHGNDDSVFVRKEKSIQRIRLSDIIWVEALGDYAVLHTADNQYVMHTTLQSIEKKLLKQHYMRVHRSFIVRIDSIDSIEDYTILCAGKEIPIGKSYREKVFRQLKMF